MSLPTPVPGLVLRYAYLWAREHALGVEEGSKDRPAVILLTLMYEDGDTIVTVLPVTHRPPANPEEAVEIPLLTKRRLGLDSERSWIILSEGNRFVWPGPDLRSRPGQGPGSVAMGMLPPGLFRVVRDRFLALHRQRRGGGIVPRT